MLQSNHATTLGMIFFFLCKRNQMKEIAPFYDTVQAAGRTLDPRSEVMKFHSTLKTPAENNSEPQMLDL
jgi:hypothetical protein